MYDPLNARYRRPREPGLLERAYGGAIDTARGVGQGAAQVTGDAVNAIDAYARDRQQRELAHLRERGYAGVLADKVSDAAGTVADFVVPQSTLDAAMYVAGGPGPRALRTIGAGLLGAMEPSDAEAGGASRARRAVSSLLSPAAPATSAQEGIRAFHGSPHHFDRFDMSRIGTGEGAQAYGHGLYFAGKEDVARYYRDNLVEPKQATTLSVAGIPIMRGGAPVDYSPRTSSPMDTARATFQERMLMQPASYLADKDHARAIAAEQFQRLADDAGHPPEARRWYQTMAEALQHNAASVNLRTTRPDPGAMYEVNLRTSPERLLDWDKPVAQQPARVRDALGDAGAFHPPKHFWENMSTADGSTNRAVFFNSDYPHYPQGTVIFSPRYGGYAAFLPGNRLAGVGRTEADARKIIENMAPPLENPDLSKLTGEKAYRRLLYNPEVPAYSRAMGIAGTDNGVSSNILREAGIDGIQYLDQSSRAAGEGTRNYVVFRDDIVDILRKYGIGGLLAGGAAGAQQ